MIRDLLLVIFTIMFGTFAQEVVVVVVVVVLLHSWFYSWWHIERPVLFCKLLFSSLFFSFSSSFLP